MSNIRRKTAEHLSHAWNAIPHVTQHDKADITALEVLRKQYSAAGRAGRRQADGDGRGAEDRGRGAAQVPAVQLLGRHGAPGDRLQEVHPHRRRRRHASAACSCRCMRDVDRKGIIELAAELARRPRRRAPASCRSTTCRAAGFTITNLGGIGGTSFTPIVNWPEVAILGMSRGDLRARLRRPGVPAAPDAAAVAVLRPPRHRRRRRRPLPPLGRRGVRAAVRDLL